MRMVCWMIGTKPSNLKGSKERTHQPLPKRDVPRGEKRGNILAGWEVGVEGEVTMAGEREGESFFLREFGEK